jgi:hypothetical protein
MVTLVDRGADILVNSKRIAVSMAEGLKHGARRRVDSNEFFSFIALASLITIKPN